MSQCAGTGFRTGLHRRTPTAWRLRRQLGREDLEHSLLDELPTPSTQADADVAKVTINSAEMMVLRGIVQTQGYHEAASSRIIVLSAGERCSPWGRPPLTAANLHHRFRCADHARHAKLNVKCGVRE